MNLMNYKSKMRHLIYKSNLAYLVGRSQIVEFRLPKFNEDMDTAWRHLTQISNKVLRNDKRWHFFYENYYSIIRCSLRYQKLLRLYLIANSIDYIYRGPWVDGSKYVEAHKKSFS